MGRKLRVAGTVLLAAVPILAGPPAAAQTREVDREIRLFASPTGRGLQTGADAANAMPFRQAITLIEADARALHVRLVEGDYQLQEGQTIRLRPRGSRQHPLVIEGDGPRTRLIGTYRGGTDASPTVFGLAKSNVTIMRLTVRDAGSFIDVPNGATARGIRIRDVAIENTRDGLLIDRGKTLTASDWSIENVAVTGYHRVALRIAGTNTANIRIRGLRIDGGGQGGQVHCGKAGVQLYDGVSNVTIEDSAISGNVACADSDGGHGVEMDDRGGAPSRITLRNVTASANSGINFDINGINLTLERLQSRSEGASRFGYRFSTRAYECDRCTSDGGRSGDVALQNAEATFQSPDLAGREGGLTFSCGPGARQAGRLRVSRSDQPADERSCGTPP